MDIVLYRKFGTWCFTDPKVGLVDEPFVDGAEVILDRIAERHADPRRRLTRMKVSFRDGPGLFYELRRVGRKVRGGYHYEFEDLKGWLCPSLYKYFPKAPRIISLKVSVVGDEPTRVASCSRKRGTSEKLSAS